MESRNYQEQGVSKKKVAPRRSKNRKSRSGRSRPKTRSKAKKRVPKKEVSIPAIRAGVIKGIQMGEGKLNLMLFIKYYPNKVMAINIPALLKVINKVESISELVEFFSVSPLNNLKKQEI